MNKLWEEKIKETDKEKSIIESENCFTISDEDFLMIQKIYNFQPIRKYKAFYDNKNKKTAALVLNNSVIKFNKVWLFDEILRTTSPMLYKIMQKYLSFDKLFISLNDILQRKHVKIPKE